MVGTLTVQNLQGPTSGANANKVIIPAGQTLDASGGTLVPSSGQVVQIKHAAITASTTFSSTSYADATGFNLAITPKYTSSVIYISIWAGAEVINTSSAQGAYDHKLLRDTTSIANRRWYNYFNNSGIPDDTYPPFVLQHYDSPNTTSTITYKLQGRKYNAVSTSSQWIINDSNGGSATATMTVMEIAQ